MSASPLAAVRAAEREATQRIAAADAEAGEILQTARDEARRILDETSVRNEEQRAARLLAAQTDAKEQGEALFARGHEAAGEMAARAPPAGLVAAMLATVLPEEN